MYASKWIVGAAVVFASVLAGPAHADDSAIDARRDDDAFLLLRDAVRQDDAAKADFYAARLNAYSIPSYVDYYRLKSHFRDVSYTDIRDFLHRYEGSAIADRLRNDWLLDLGRRRDWATFDEQLPLFALNDDTQVKCYALQSRALKGQKVADEARALLVNPPVYGDGCSGLIATLAQTGQFDANDLWTQVRLAGEFDATGPGKRAMLLLGGPDKKIAQAIDLPAIALAKGMGSGRIEHEIYLVAIGRMAKTSVKLAVLALNKVSSRLSAQEQAQGWANIALQSSYTLAPETRAYWRKSAGAPLSIDAQQWKTRYALRRRLARSRRRHPRHAGRAAQRRGVDLLAGARADGRGQHQRHRPGQRRRAAAVPQHRRPIEFLRPAGAGGNRPPDHDSAGRRADLAGRNRPHRGQPRLPARAEILRHAAALRGHARMELGLARPERTRTPGRRRIRAPE